jgi:hypothetical protein
MALEIVLLVAAGAANGLKDASALNRFKTPYFNKKESWRFKYAQPLQKGNHWYYFNLYKPPYKEAFPLSATALVFLTDFWHLTQFVTNTALIAIIALHLPFTFEPAWLGFLIKLSACKLVYLIPFQVVFSIVK